MRASDRGVETPQNLTDAQLANEVRALCTRDLVLHRTPPPSAWLRRLADSPYAALPWDVYGVGGAADELGRRIAELLGKPAALFFSRGVIAQQVALRIWATSPRPSTVAVDAKSHLQLAENDAIERLSGLSAIPITSSAGMTVANLAAIAEPIGAVTVELPLRRAGFQLPTWSELVEISDWCRARGIPLHIDGARLWESGAWFGRSYAEIAGLADSIYISLYKGLGAPSGAMLAGDADFMAKAKVWRLRYGGAPYRNVQSTVAALHGLDTHLPKMADYVARAIELAADLKAVGFKVTPDPPRSNAFHLFVAVDPQRLQAAHLAFAQSTASWLFNEPTATQIPGFAALEFMIGDGAEDFTNAEIIDSLAQILDKARA